MVTRNWELCEECATKGSCKGILGGSGTVLYPACGGGLPT